MMRASIVCLMWLVPRASAMVGGRQSLSRGDAGVIRRGQQTGFKADTPPGPRKAVMSRAMKLQRIDEMPIPSSIDHGSAEVSGSTSDDALNQDEQAVAEAMLLPRLQAIREHEAILELKLQRLAAPTIRNGDFESEQRPNDEYFMLMSRDGQVNSACSLTGWSCTHSVKGVFLSRGGNDGLNCVALRSGGASISQTLTGLTTGQTYRLTYLASNRQRFLKKSDLKTTVTSGSTTLAMEEFTPTIFSWDLRSFTFTATETSCVLNFENADSDSGDGPVFVDDIHLTTEETPRLNEPMPRSVATANVNVVEM